MSKKPKTLSDADILTRVAAKAAQAVGWYDSRLSKERARVLDYYNGKLPRRQHEGSSSYVSTDVYDSVEMMKSQLLETFAAGDDIAQFDPDQDMNAEQCRVATAYARHVIFRSNPGYAIFNDVIHDGLTARAGIFKCYWEAKYEYIDEEFSNLTFEEAQALAAQENVDEFDAEADEYDMFSGTMCRKLDTSKIVIEGVAPEEFLIAKTATSIEEGDCHWRTKKTKQQLLDMGFDKTKVNAIKFDDADENEQTDESRARNEPLGGTELGDDTPMSDEVAKVTFFETYVKMQIKSEKGVRLYRVLHTADALFEKQEVDRKPFHAYVPLPIPHLFYGNNYAARVIPTQNAKTVLTRAILDHTVTTTNPRWAVVRGGLANPREMLENRLGGIVNVNRPDSVAALQQANLNPFVFQTVGLLGENNEKSTGISALSQGLNKDAISKQNSQGLVGDLVNLSTGRQKIAARNFAYNTFVPLMMEVIRLTIAHEKKSKVIEVAGNWETIDPRAWTERRTASVSMHLGYGERDKAMGYHVEAHKMLEASAGPMYTPENKYELFRDTMKLAGLNSAAKYITHPSKTQAPQPDPLKVKELEIKDKSASAALMSAQATTQKTAATIQVDATRVSLDKAKAAHAAAIAERDGERHDLETVNRIDVAQREMALAESMPEETRSATIAPNNF